MVTMFIAIVVACGAFSAAHYAADIGTGWSVAIGVAAFAAFQAVFAVVVKKRVTRDMESVQAILAEGQKKLQAKMQRWQVRPPGSIQAAQKEIMEDTRVFVGKALEETEKMHRYKLWVPMMERQVATAQLQLCWMVKDFRRVDQLMPKALFMDPTLVAMKLARMQMQNKDVAEIRAAYEKGVKRLRYNQNALLAATYSWILVQRKDIDGAFKALNRALEKSDNETLKANRDALANNRVAHFSNANIGDTWWAIGLEEPKVKMQRQRMQWR